MLQIYLISYINVSNELFKWCFDSSRPVNTIKFSSNRVCPKAHTKTWIVKPSFVENLMQICPIWSCERTSNFHQISLKPLSLWQTQFLAVQFPSNLRQISIKFSSYCINKKLFLFWIKIVSSNIECPKISCTVKIMLFFLQNTKYPHKKDVNIKNLLQIYDKLPYIINDYWLCLTDPIWRKFDSVNRPLWFAKWCIQRFVLFCFLRISSLQENYQSTVREWERMKEMFCLFYMYIVFVISFVESSNYTLLLYFDDCFVVSTVPDSTSKNKVAESDRKPLLWHL